MIRVNVQIIVKEENRAELLEVLNVLATNSRIEAGCLAYDVYENVSTEEKLFIFETWENEEFLKMHQQTSHYVSKSPQLRKLALDVKVEKFIY